jgi:uncharacterized membrane protein YeaQ/YmgE (transglycosylase-associated protein family)
MSDDPGLLVRIGVKLPDLIAGLAGGITNALIFKRSDPFAAVASVIVGALAANYLSDPAMNVLGIYTPGRGASSFIVGLAGMALCQAIVAAVQAWKPGRSVNGFSQLPKDKPP